jgi:hypothetical protein
MGNSKSKQNVENRKLEEKRFNETTAEGFASIRSNRSANMAAQNEARTQASITANATAAIGADLIDKANGAAGMIYVSVCELLVTVNPFYATIKYDIILYVRVHLHLSSEKEASQNAGEIAG